MSYSRSLLLYQDNPAYGLILKLIISILPAAMLVASIYVFLYGDNFRNLALLVQAIIAEGTTFCELLEKKWASPYNFYNMKWYLHSIKGQGKLPVNEYIDQLFKEYVDISQNIFFGAQAVCAHIFGLASFNRYVTSHYKKVRQILRLKVRHSITAIKRNRFPVFT